VTDLERLELVLRRVHDRLDRTTRFGASSELYLLKKIIEEVTAENNGQYEQTKKQRA
jgi:hypothetical protein